MGMNLKQAHYIRTIAQEGSITTAARKLYVSQPSLSQMVRQIENELGVTLFDRNATPLRLTYAGEKCLECANAMLNASRRLEDQIQEIRRENSGKLRLGISVQRAMQVLPVALSWFAMQYPGVAIELKEAGSAKLEELLLQGEIDLALAAIDSVDARLSYVLIEKESIGILAGKGSALAARFAEGTPVALEAAADDSFISLKEGHSIRVVQDSLFRQSGMAPRILIETDSLEVGRRVALANGACMLCSEIYVDEYVRRLGAFYPLRDYENDRHFYACYRKDERLPRYAEGFVQIVTQMLSQKNLR